jgi:hypothetical protein
MKVLRIHAAGTDPELAASVSSAVDSFNRGIDIRLRFLSIEIDETVVEAPDPESAAAVVGELVRTSRPALCVLLGHGVAALAAGAAAVRVGARLVRVGAGCRQGEGADAERAMDRLASVCLVFDEAAFAALADEGLSDRGRRVGSQREPRVGERIVGELARARRAAQGGG